MNVDTALPPALFDLDDPAAPIFDPTTKAATLTPYGAHHGLGPGVWTAPLCSAARYGSLVSDGRRVWIWHACPLAGAHTTHHCDRCEETW